MEFCQWRGDFELEVVKIINSEICEAGCFKFKSDVLILILKIKF